MWSSLNLYDQKSSCYIQRLADGALTIAMKKNASILTPPRLVGTTQEIKDFINEHKLPDIGDWASECIEVVPSTSIHSPSPVKKASFDSAEFLRRQRERLLREEDEPERINMMVEFDNQSAQGATVSTSQASSQAVSGQQTPQGKNVEFDNQSAQGATVSSQASYNDQQPPQGKNKKRRVAVVAHQLRKKKRRVALVRQPLRRKKLSQ